MSCIVTIIIIPSFINVYILISTFVSLSLSRFPSLSLSLPMSVSLYPSIPYPSPYLSHLSLNIIMCVWGWVGVREWVYALSPSPIVLSLCVNVCLYMCLSVSLCLSNSLILSLSYLRPHSFNRQSNHSFNTFRHKPWFTQPPLFQKLIKSTTCHGLHAYHIPPLSLRNSQHHNLLHIFSNGFSEKTYRWFLSGLRAWVCYLSHTVFLLNWYAFGFENKSSVNLKRNYADWKMDKLAMISANYVKFYQ